MHLTNQITHSTVRIQTVSKGGAKGSGTGSIFRFCYNGKVSVPSIVTNKHVVRGADSATVQFTLDDGAGKPLYGKYTNIELTNFQQGWLDHPDPNVDLCALPISHVLSELEKFQRRPYFRAINREIVADQKYLQDLTAMEDVVMVGYPIGLWDSHNNLPVLRRGVTATPPGLHFDGRTEFLIDCACFPGSSGSPVFLYNNSGYADATGDFVLGSPRMKLIGVLYAGPQYEATGEIKIVPVPTNVQTIAVSRIPTNLGIVINSTRVLELEDFVRSKFPSVATSEP